jgi:hypothetical protein
VGQGHRKADEEARCLGYFLSQTVYRFLWGLEDEWFGTEQHAGALTSSELELLGFMDLGRPTRRSPEAS